LRDFYDLADLEKAEDEMRTIGILHYQVGGTDGVSLEIGKWTQVVDEMGHTVRLRTDRRSDVDGSDGKSARKSSVVRMALTRALPPRMAGEPIPATA
jgi:hypothetical protein